MAEIEVTEPTLEELLAEFEKLLLNGRICCLLGGCGCPPGGVARAEALAALLRDKAGCCPRDANRAAAFTTALFGLVPKALETAILSSYEPKATPGASF